MDIGKLLLLGAAGFVAYEYYSGAFSSAPAPSPTAPGIQPATPAQAATNPVTTSAMVLNAATQDHFDKGSVDQWNFYYSKVRGIPAPDPGSWGITPETRPQILTFAEWWALGSSHGLAGYRRVN